MAVQVELIQTFKNWVAEYIHDDALHAGPVTWDAALVAVPGPQGVQAGVGCFFSIPGLLLGQQITNFTVLSAEAVFNEEGVAAFVHDALEGLTAARSQQATQALAGDASTPETMPQKSSIILPGS